MIRRDCSSDSREAGKRLKRTMTAHANTVPGSRKPTCSAGLTPHAHQVDDSPTEVPRLVDASHRPNAAARWALAIALVGTIGLGGLSAWVAPAWATSSTQTHSETDLVPESQRQPPVRSRSLATAGLTALPSKDASVAPSPA